jgi:hypothetical protein
LWPYSSSAVAISTAPSWGGTIIATKSRSTLPLGYIIISAIIFFMAAALSVRNGFSFARAARVLVGSCAKANDVAVTDRVVASETTRLRMKERDNKTTFTSGRLQQSPARMAPRPSLVFPRCFLEGHPNKTPGSAIAVPGWVEHDGLTQGSQLKTNLQFRIRISICAFDALMHNASM